MFSTPLVLQRHMSAMREVDRKDDNPQKKRSEHPISGFGREAIIPPVASARIRADPNGCTNDYEKAEGIHSPLFGKTHPSIKAFSDTRAASSDIPEHSLTRRASRHKTPEGQAVVLLVLRRRQPRRQDGR